MVRKFILHTNNIVRTEFLKYAYPYLIDPSVQKMRHFIQHGNTTCLSHCVAVAYYSLAFFIFLKIKCDERSLVEGAILHDYFLYDWHDSGHSSVFKLHGFRHARIAYENAHRDFIISPKSEDIILKHMFPLNLTPPRCFESIVVSCIDKLCSVYEVFSRSGYRPLVGILEKD